jgi:hypothetical protein
MYTNMNCPAQKAFYDDFSMSENENMARQGVARYAPTTPSGGAGKDKRR